MTPSFPPATHRWTCRATAAWAGALVALALVAGCTPQPPDTERPPVPKAVQHTQMRDAIQAPLDKARNVEADMQKSADAQRAAIDAQTD